ncbi:MULTISPECIES: hypothetical protein [unclassified Streptomyces]|uniref:hypothetical protein n=1 Tax=unclassified Streptomyces TaxID=2593676 RepID=UPI0011E6E674|nr:hypothetical protein [Streptomyces sp. sk2.1]TXS58053.1 hypothetical protein EAO76_43735 [Streptomyces sp. sk2.1]
MYDRHADEVPPLPPAPVAHEPTTVERGSFCTARCGCGWYGPARRSRDRARADATEHLAAP